MVDDSDERDRTLWCGNLDNKVTDEILYDLFLQAGPLERVRIATDRETQRKKGFAFITFQHAVSVPYTIDLMNGLQLFERPLRLQTRPGSIHEQAANALGSSMVQHGPPHVMHRSFSAPNVDMGGGVNSPAPNYDPDVSDHQRDRDRDHRREGGHRRHGGDDRGHRDRSSDRNRDRDRSSDRDRNRDRDRDRGSDYRDHDRNRGRVRRAETEPGMPPSLLGMPMVQYNSTSHMTPQHRHRGGRDQDYRSSPNDPDFLLAQVNQMADYCRQMNQQPSRRSPNQWHRGGGSRY